MQINVSSQPGRVPITIFQIVGDIDTSNYDQLQEQARQAHAAGAANMVLDLTHVGYISSAGIRALNSIYVLLRTDAPAESDAAVRQGINAGTFKSPHLKRLRHLLHLDLNLARLALVSVLDDVG